jgi:peptidoglycan/LPS O-acetylase OafA/YrhL
MKQESKSRLDWIDNLRTLMILLVVNMHACVTYSHVGDWYYNAPPDPTVAQKIPYAIWQAHLQSFFMGLLFLISGYFSERSLRRRGQRPFIAERLRRLGIPTLLYMLVLHPLIVIGMHPWGGPTADPGQAYLHYIVSGAFVGSSGPMWFAFALLIFSLVFAFTSPNTPFQPKPPQPVSGRAVLAVAAVLAITSFFVRTVQPIGTNILNFQLCYFPQYVVAFVVGIALSRTDSLSLLAESRMAKRVGWAAVVLGPIVLMAVLVACLPIAPGERPAAFGGWHWQAAAYATWEQFTGIGLSLGIMALCLRKLNLKTAFLSWLSDRSFAVYVIHPPILVGLALLAQPYRIGTFPMILGLTVAGWVCSFGIGDIVRRLPGLKSIL